MEPKQKTGGFFRGFEGRQEYNDDEKKMWGAAMDTNCLAKRQTSPGQSRLGSNYFLTAATVKIAERSSEPAINI
jgi:hypothetical protein